MGSQTLRRADSVLLFVCCAPCLDVHGRAEFSPETAICPWLPFPSVPELLRPFFQSPSARAFFRPLPLPFWHFRLCLLEFQRVPSTSTVPVGCSGPRRERGLRRNFQTFGVVSVVSHLKITCGHLLPHFLPLWGSFILTNKQTTPNKFRSPNVSVLTLVPFPPSFSPAQ